MLTKRLDRVRSQRGLVVATVLVGSLGLPGVAHARHGTEYRSKYLIEGGAPEWARRSIGEQSFAARPIMLELRTGVATVVGLFGATASFDPWSRLCLGAGLGANSSGAQLAAFGRVRPLVFMGKRWARLHAVGLELGYSTGPFSNAFIDSRADPSGGSGPTYSYDRVHWLQPQITYETRSYRGFNLLAGIGVEIPLATQGYHCLKEELCAENEIGVLPTFTVGLGWAIGL